ncbi:MAG: hypothetical protein M3P18_22305, partial [Actinomycetota bacterium]|nr:hypothetical protein [Actinomycetota bacterium]
VLERVSVHAPVAEMFHHQTYAVGLILQVLTAIAGALLILLLTRAIGQIYLSMAGLGLRHLVRSPLPRLHPGAEVCRHRDLVGNIGVRGPPKIARI